MEYGSSSNIFLFVDYHIRMQKVRLAGEFLTKFTMYNLLITRLHLGRSRKVMPGQRIHKSVFNDQSNYKPKARIQDKGMTWEDVKSSAEMVEQDPFTDASVILSDMRERSQSDFSNENLTVLISLSQTIGQSWSS